MVSCCGSLEKGRKCIFVDHREVRKLCSVVEFEAKCIVRRENKSQVFVFLYICSRKRLGNVATLFRNSAVMETGDVMTTRMMTE